MERHYLVRHHLVRGGLGVTAPMTATVTLTRVDFGAVLDEIRLSSRRRAAAHELVDEQHVVGVVAGTSPVMWVDEGAAPERVCALAADAPELHEVYVHAGNTAVISALCADGWSRDEAVEHVVHDGEHTELCMPPSGYVLRECDDPAVLPAVRALLLEVFEMPREELEAAYPDDFFVKAAPARLLIAETADGELAGLIGRRRQQDSAILYALAVAPAHRSAALGTALARTATARAIADGATFVHGIVEAASSTLARSAGFRPVVTWMRLQRRADDAVA